jgi:hypothetical protein
LDCSDTAIIYQGYTTIHGMLSPALDHAFCFQQAPNLEQLEVLESTSKSLLPTSIEKDNGKDCLDRMVSLDKLCNVTSYEEHQLFKFCTFPIQSQHSSWKTV